MNSPYQKLYNKSPSFLHLKTFGCLYYPWTAYSHTHKLELKSSPYIFLGYSTNHKGFRCFDPATSKLLISLHIRFHEHEFPMAKPTTTSPFPQISTIHNPLPPPLSPNFYPPPNHLPSTNQTTSPNSPAPSPLKSDTHIQNQRRLPHPTTLPPSTLPPLLPSAAPSTPTPTPNRPPHTHPMKTHSHPTNPNHFLNISLTTTDPLTYNQASSNPHWQQAMAIEISALHNQQTCT